MRTTLEVTQEAAKHAREALKGGRRVLFWYLPHPEAHSPIPEVGEFIETVEAEGWSLEQLGIYARRSRPEELEPDSNVGFRTSTERQLHARKQAAELKGWAVSDRHLREAGVSGYTGKRRSEFEWLIADLEASSRAC
jgi:Resolvase, N terminal domain